MEPLAYTFRIGTDQIGRLLEGIEPSLLDERPGETNSIHWQIGHIAGARRMLCGMIGMSEALGMADWCEFFNMGRGHEREAEWPSVDFLIDDLRSVGEKLCQRLDGMTRKEAEAPLTAKGWGDDARVWQAIQFLAWHESYHIGQVGTARRMLGYSGLV